MRAGGRRRAPPDAATAASRSTLRPNENWQRLPRRPVRAASASRSTACATRAATRPASSEHARRRPARADRRRAARRPRLAATCATTPRPAWSSALSQAEGDFALPRPRRAASALLLISGGSGITPGDVDAAHALRRGPRGPITFLHYARRTSRRRSTRDELAELAAAHPNVRARCAASRADRRAASSTAASRREHARRASRSTAAAGETFVVRAGRARRRRRATTVGARTSSTSASTSSSFAPPGARRVETGRRADGSVRFARSGPRGRRRRRAAARAGRGRRPHARVTAAAWASATPAPAASSTGAVRNVRTGEVSTAAPTSRSSICVSAPGRRRRRSTSDHRLDQEPSHDHHRTPQLTPEQLDAFGARARRHPRARDSPTSASATPTTSAASSRPSAASRSPAAACCSLGFLPPAWLAGTAALVAVEDPRQHGDRPQRDARPVRLDEATRRSIGTTFEWDTACPGDQWRHSHNYMHHTFTNILGKDRDIGYGILRMTEDQQWHPYYLGNPVYATLLAAVLPVGRGAARPRGRAGRGRQDDLARAAARCCAAIWRKAGRQALKDYVLFPLLAGPVGAGRRSPATPTANLIRNVWTFTIIFCGHFPDGVARVHRGGDRGRDARRVVPAASCSARPTSTAASCSTS